MTKRIVHEVYELTEAEMAQLLQSLNTIFHHTPPGAGRAAWQSIIEQLGEVRRRGAMRVEHNGQHVLGDGE